MFRTVKVFAKRVALALFWLSLGPTFLWTYAYVNFLLLTPRRVQHDLFGEQLVGISALRAAQNDCCLSPLPDGRRMWVYEVSDTVAARFAARCTAAAPPGGVGLIWAGSHECIVASRLFGPNGIDGGAEARLTDNRLTLSVDWL